VRPGLIVGPHDSTDRFGYWVARFRQPALLGDRAEQAVVPAPNSAPVQFIDARDLADWMIHLVEAKQSGTFNATSPSGHWTWGLLVDALGRSGAPPPAWVDEALLLEHKVEPWTGLPLWIPVDVRRRGRLHGVRLPPRAGCGTAYSPARGDDRRHGGVACARATTAAHGKPCSPRKPSGQSSRSRRAA
jgi:nucleoside-diphosphate-sugar epimerase